MNKSKHYHTFQMWRARRTAQTRIIELDKRFAPLIAAAKKKGDQDELGSLDAEFSMERDLVFDPIEQAETYALLAQARKLGIPFSLNVSDHDLWKDSSTGYQLTVSGKAQLRSLIRKEKTERVEYRMLWITRVIVPLIGLLGAVMGTIATLTTYMALIHKKP